MFDEFFSDLRRDLDTLQKDIAELKSHLNGSNGSAPKLFDTKAIARVSGIPYNTLINQKHLLPHVSKSVKIGTKRYYRSEIVMEWLEDISYNGRKQ
jgi:hypothetical protein